MLDSLKSLDALVRSGGPSVVHFRQKRQTQDESGMVSPYTTSVPKVKGAFYAFGLRADAEGNPLNCVGLASKAAHINHMEAELSARIKDGHPLLSKLNRVRVDYGTHTDKNGKETHIGAFTDLDFPGKLYDTHIRAAWRDGSRVDDDPEYRKASVDSPERVAALLKIAANTHITGGWESRRPNGAKFASIIRGETYGVLVDQAEPGNWPDSPSKYTQQGGWRTDPATAGSSDAGVKEEIDLLVKAISGLDLTRNSAGKGGKGWERLSEFGIGNAPGSGHAGVAVRSIHRVSSISLPLIRDVRLGGTAEEDLAVRRVMLAHALVLEALGTQHTHYRSGCTLIEAEKPQAFVDLKQVEHPGFEGAVRLLEEALDAAKGLSVGWEGNLYEAKGDPNIQEAIVSLRAKSNTDESGDNSASEAK